MNPETVNQIEDFLRSMRQAFNGRKMKAYRTHFWTNSKFIHLDSSGRMDHGWGAFEEILDQELRYLDSIQLNLRNLNTQLFEDRFASVVGEWKLVQVDASGNELESGGRVSFVIVRFGKDWKIVTAHYTRLETVAES